MPLVTISLDMERDQSLQYDPTSVMRQIDAVQKSKWWGVGGSQEFSRFVVAVEGYEITAEAETFFGLEISGEQEIVERIADLVRAGVIDEADRRPTVVSANLAAPWPCFWP